MSALRVDPQRQSVLVIEDGGNHAREVPLQEFERRSAELGGIKASAYATGATEFDSVAPQPGSTTAAAQDAREREVWRKSLFHELARAGQPELLVIEFTKGSPTYQFRHMRRSEILAEARKYGLDIAAMVESQLAHDGSAVIRAQKRPSATTEAAVVNELDSDATAVGRRDHDRAHADLERHPRSGSKTTTRRRRGRGAAENSDDGARGSTIYSGLQQRSTSQGERDRSQSAGLHELQGAYRDHDNPSPMGHHRHGRRSDHSSRQQQWHTRDRNYNRDAERQAAFTASGGGGGHGPGSVIADRQRTRTGAVTSYLQSRDLRVIDPSFEISKQPAVLVRRHAIVLNLPPMRVIILPDKAWLLPEEGADEDLAPVIERLTGQGSFSNSSTDGSTAVADASSEKQQKGVRRRKKGGNGKPASSSSSRRLPQWPLMPPTEPLTQRAAALTSGLSGSFRQRPGFFPASPRAAPAVTSDTADAVASSAVIGIDAAAISAGLASVSGAQSQPSVRTPAAGGLSISAAGYAALDDVTARQPVVAATPQSSPSASSTSGGTGLGTPTKETPLLGSHHLGTMAQHSSSKTIYGAAATRGVAGSDSLHIAVPVRTTAAAPLSTAENDTSSAVAASGVPVQLLPAADSTPVETDADDDDADERLSTSHLDPLQVVLNNDAGTFSADELPFEFVVLETVLLAVVAHLKREHNSLAPMALQTISMLTQQRGGQAHMFDMLRRAKRAANDFISKIRAVHRVIGEVLDTPEDLRSMALTALLDIEKQSAREVAEALHHHPRQDDTLDGGPSSPAAMASSTAATGAANAVWSSPHPSASAAALSSSPLAAATVSLERPQLDSHYSRTAPSSCPQPLAAARARQQRTSGPLAVDIKAAAVSPSAVAYLDSTSSRESAAPIDDGARSSRFPPVEAVKDEGYRAPRDTAAAVVVEGIPLDDVEDAAEVLLEAYLAEIELVLLRAKLLRDELDGAEDQVNLVLATGRNRLLRVEIALTTVTMAMTASTVVSSFFGMNLRNSMEDNDAAFVAIVVGCSAGALLLILALGLYLRTALK